MPDSIANLLKSKRHENSCVYFIFYAVLYISYIIMYRRKDVYFIVV